MDEDVMARHNSTHFIRRLCHCTVFQYVRIVLVVGVFYLMTHLVFIMPPPVPDLVLDGGGHGLRPSHIIIHHKSNKLDVTSNTRKLHINTNISSISVEHLTPHGHEQHVQHDEQQQQAPPVSTGDLPTVDVTNSQSIRQWMMQQNELLHIHNLRNTSQLQPNHTVIVVQVHNRPEYLRHLIESLRKATGIEDVLIVFSHDFYSKEINSIIAGIKFCKVLQIFYPYNMQIYPHTFPGEHPRDCPRDAKKPDALKLGCLNADHPDKFGHYREAKYCQTKHHWFWKLQFLFESIPVLEAHTGLFLFLEEDHYLTEDGLHVLHLMHELRRKEHAECNILCLGDYNKKLPKKVDSNKVDIMMWLSNKHNMGMALDRATYHTITLCTKMFCTYDDYNWDWSLMYISQKCMLPKLVVMAVKVARVLHIGECGLHKKSKHCQPKAVITRIEQSFKPSFNMFPAQLQIGIKKINAIKMPKVNGGWADVRDHNFCQNYTIDQLLLLQR